MSERMPADGAIRVGDFVIDLRSGELRDGAGRQTLSTQPLQVLAALLERPGVLVSRDELRARLWPADTFVDFEHGLNAVVKRLRDALGDSADAPRYIETVPRRGYRLVAEVRAIDGGAEPTPGPASVGSAPAFEPQPTPADPAAATPSRPAAATLGLARRGVTPAAAVLAGIAVFALAVSAYHFGPRRHAQAAVEGTAAPVRLTFGPGLQIDAAWSPDGRRIAYAADTDGNFDLFTQSLDGGAATRITASSANEMQPAWSPDGRRIVFRSDADGGGIYTIGVDGGAIRRIAETGYEPAWMPDGRDIVFAASLMAKLYLVDADGDEGPREILADAMRQGGWRAFAVHPDGRIGLLGLQRESRFGFFVSDREHHRLRSVTSGTTIPEAFRLGATRVVWSKAGDAVYVEAFASSVPAVWRVAVDPDTLTWHEPVQLPIGPAAADRVAVSPDGARLAFTSFQNMIRAWVFPFDADRGTLLGEGRAVTDEDAWVSGLQTSADGRSLYYQETRPGRSTVRGVQTQLDTGETKVLYPDASSGPVPAMSGSGIAYLLSRPNSGASDDDFEYALAWRSRDDQERLLSRWGAGALFPTDVRRDDRAVLATRLVRDFIGPGALVEWPVGPSAASEPHRVLLESPKHTIWQGHYSPDGRWVTFVAAGLEDGWPLELGIVPSDVRRGTAWTRLAADHAWPDKPRWSPDGRTLYFLSQSGGLYFSLWGVRMDPERGVQAGEPFLIRAFDSPRWHIAPYLGGLEMGVAKGVLALPMRSVRGSIWIASSEGT